MLRELQFSYLLYTVIIVTGNLTVFLSIRRWGKHADHIGNISIIKLTSLLISILPLLWIINRNPVYLIVIQVFAGLVWGGFNISTFNFIFDAVPSPDRTRSIAYFNVINGVAIFAGSLTGGIIMQRLPSLFGSQILTLLFISSVLRFIGALFLMPGLQEVRTVKKVNGFNLFSSMIGIRSILDIEKKPLQ
jgi:MFS family permease